MKQKTQSTIQEQIRQATIERDKQIRAMRKAGKTLQTIADAVGLTRARVHQIVRTGIMWVNEP